MKPIWYCLCIIQDVIHLNIRLSKPIAPNLRFKSRVEVLSDVLLFHLLVEPRELDYTFIIVPSGPVLVLSSRIFHPLLDHKVVHADFGLIIHHISSSKQLRHVHFCPFRLFLCQSYMNFVRCLIFGYVVLPRGVELFLLALSKHLR